MRPPDHAISIDLEVPFHDVDAMKIVWHGHYLKYVELARTALLRSRGLDVDSVVAGGYAMMVTESRCRHSYPLRYGDKFRVIAWCAETHNRIRIKYEIRNLTENRRSARGHTVLVTTDLDGNMQYETPAFILTALQD